MLSRSPWPPAAAEPLMEAHDHVHEIPAAAFFSSCMIFTGPSTMLPMFHGEHLHAFLSTLTTLLHAAFACMIYVYMPCLHILNHMRQLFLNSKFYSVSSRSMRAIFFIHSSYVFTELRRALVATVHGATGSKPCMRCRGCFPSPVRPSACSSL